MPGKIDLMIAGAQKSGTTSLKNYLMEHPSIAGHIQTEFTYFIDDNEYSKGFQNAILKYYRFRNRPAGLKSIAKSIVLFTDENAIKRLYDHNPDCKIVLLLRNPVDRAYSSFNMEVFNGWPYSDFSVIKQAIENPEGELSEVYKILVGLGLYAEHINKLMKYFPKESIRIFLFEEFVENPVKVCQEIFTSLNLDSTLIPDTNKIYNKTYLRKSRLFSSLMAVLRKRNNPIKETTKSIIPYSTFTKLAYKLLEINKSQKVNSPMDPELRKFLADYFEPHNQKLTELMKVDIHRWEN